MEPFAAERLLAARPIQLFRAVQAIARTAHDFAGLVHVDARAGEVIVVQGSGAVAERPAEVPIVHRVNGDARGGLDLDAHLPGVAAPNSESEVVDYHPIPPALHREHAPPLLERAQLWPCRAVSEDEGKRGGRELRGEK